MKTGQITIDIRTVPATKTLLADFIQWVHTDEFGSVEPGYDRDRAEQWAGKFLSSRDRRRGGPHNHQGLTK